MNIDYIANKFMRLATMSNEQAHQIIGVPPHASDQEINTAYKQQMKKYHPDINPSEEAKIKSVELNIAKELLLNPERQGIHGDLRRENEETMSKINDILDREQAKADAWLEDIREKRREYEDYLDNKIKREDLKHPDNIAHVKKILERQKEFKKQRRKELLNKKRGI